MSVNLAALVRKAHANPAVRVLVYGQPGDGKTTFAASWPNPIFIQTEDGTPGNLEFDAIKATNFAEVMDAIGALYEGEHKYKTLVVDSISSLQPMIFAETCVRHGKKSIEEFSYGRGYVEAQKVQAEFIDGVNALRDQHGMHLVLIAHSTVTRFDDPETQSYSQHAIDMHGKLSPMIERDMDAIFLLKKQVTVKSQDVGFNKERTYAEGGGTIFIHTESRPAYVAKNRYGMPHKIRLPKDESGFAQVSSYFPKAR